MHDSISNVYQIAIAGLLHDIGKILQRSRTDPWQAPESASTDEQPVYAAWSLEFSNHLPASYRNAARAGAYHHAPDHCPGPDSFLSELVALADKLSAGERADMEDDRKSEPPQQMVSIFDRVSLTGKPKVENFLPLRALSLKGDVLFPGDPLGKADRLDSYESLSEIIATAAKQEIEDPASYLENLAGAIQVAAWCVPSAYYHSVPDVSLYDHSRMTAALAVCLMEHGPERVRALLGAVRRDFQQSPDPGDQALLAQPAVLLVGGDISGVQNFLYTLSSKRAARSLRGRSFYLQLLTEAVLRYVLHELNLPATNVIYSGGGHFYLLAPLSAQQKLLEIRRYVTTTLLRYHGSNLYLALDSAEVPAGGFRRGEFPVHWEHMHQSLSAAKLRRYTELGDDLYARVFAVPEEGGSREHTCAVCGSESEYGQPLKIPGEPDAWICSLCNSFADEIGRSLPHSPFVILGFGPPQTVGEASALAVLGAFGMSVRFARPGETIQFPPGVERAIIWALDDPQDWPHVQGLPAARLQRYTVRQVPPKEFDDLANDARGRAGLGVLRMDVDNLGQIFQHGFGASTGASLATLSRIATLSFQLALFFEGWVKQICAQNPDQIYAVYAGGDDLFLIAPWSETPGLALKIDSDFKRYTGANPDLHASGGMAFIHGKYPVYQAAADAGAALEQAKRLEGKDAFSFLGQPWKWPDFEQVRLKYERLHKLVSPVDRGGLGAPQSILQRLRQFAVQESLAAEKKESRPVWGPWMWLIPYTFTRMQERGKGEEVKSEIQSIRDELPADNFRQIGQWGAAARWAQLSIREKSTRLGREVSST